jgi:beta,beta-carotene 9',10'-dioxygenase
MPAGPLSSNMDLAAQRPDAEARAPYALGFSSLEREVSGVALPVDGALPPWLSGNLIRTGPAKFEVRAQSYQHWFDGLAMLHCFCLDDGSVTYSNRFLHSRSFREAMESGRIARGEFMTDPCRTLFGRIMSFFNPRLTDNACVNVSVLARQMVALTETPLPVRFDPDTLETLGTLHYDNAIGGQISTAHPHHDGRRGYSYVISMGRKSAYRIFTDAAGTQRVLCELPVDRPAYMHSFGMSERFLVLTEFPLRVNPLRLAFSGEPFIRNYRWAPEAGTVITVISKADGSVVARAKAASCFAFHHVNAFESEGALRVDLLSYPDAGIIEQLRLARLRSAEPVNAAGRLTRLCMTIGGATGALAEATQVTLCEHSLELPRINYARCAGHPYQFLWGAGQTKPGDFIDNITKIELDRAGRTHTKVWHQEGCYPGEPVFVARPGATAEDDGLLLSVVLDTAARRSFLLVLDAGSLDEVARSAAPHHIPFGFHGNHFPDAARGETVSGPAAR